MRTLTQLLRALRALTRRRASISGSRYSERHGTSGAKFAPGDAKVLADLVRTDRHNHREVAGDSELVERIKIIARAHQNAIWEGCRRTFSRPPHFLY